MTAPLLLALCAACLSSANSAGADELELPSAQPAASVSVESGGALTLSCVHRGDLGVARLSWYKETRGRRPRHVSAFYSHNANGTFYPGFRDSRFSLHTAGGRNDLKIRDVRGSDAGTYHCISCFLHTLEFIQTVAVQVRDPGVLGVPGVSVHQPALESVRPGGSVNLSCTVHAAACEGEPHVSWFLVAAGEKTGVGGGGGAGACARNGTSHTCVYHLPLRNLNLSHAGTYYCAAAACGLLLTGNGTRLDFGDAGSAVPPLRWYFLGGAFGVTLAALLALLACETSGRRATGDTSLSSKIGTKEIQDAEKTYFPILQRRRRGDPTWSECVYHCRK